MVSVIVVMRLFCAGIVAAQKPDPAILHGTTAMPPESVPLPVREQQSRHNQHRDTGQSYPDGIHDLRQNPPISKPCRELFRHGLHELTRIQSVLISEICVKKHFPAGCGAAQPKHQGGAAATALTAPWLSSVTDGRYKCRS